MKREHSHTRRSFDPADYPVLREFFSAYLHEDFGEEYGSAAEAVKGYFAEASGDEILRVKDEWSRLRRALSGWRFKEVQGALGKLGSAWLPQNEGELKTLDEIFFGEEAS